MSNIVTIKGQEIDLTDRKVQCETFGKQFKVDATAYEYIKMCDERIKSYEGYITNLKELREVKLREKAEEHKEELKAMLEAMSEEERTNFINGLN
jgi:hypothetical protein